MWLLFALLNPVIESFRGVYSKKSSKTMHPLIVSLTNNIFPLFFLLPLLFFVEVNFTERFVLGVVVSGTINVFAVILFHSSLSKGDISLVMPMLSFTPLFMLVTSPIFVQEYPSTPGYIGILLIVIGSYLLNVNYRSASLFAPLKSLVVNKGSRYMLIVALLWSVSANFDKIAIKESGIIAYLAFVNVVIAAGVTVIALIRKPFKLKEIESGKTPLFIFGLVATASFLVHSAAIQMASNVSYVIALRRTTGMISVLLGKWMFQEEQFKDRLLGSAIMFAGIIVIALA